MFVESNQDFLYQFHQHTPGSTSRLMADLHAGKYPSSYELVAAYIARIAEASPIVLDLACGDGYLLSCLRKRRPDIRLMGVDFSERELAKARERLGAADLVRGSVYAFGIPDTAVDIIVCHMAFMLFDSPHTVLSEIERVLKPGGIFVAVTAVPSGGGVPSSNILPVFMRCLKAVYRHQGLNLLTFGGSRHVQDRETLQALLAKAAPQLKLESFTVVDCTLEIPLESIWQKLLLFYDVARLPERARVNLKQSFRNAMQANETSARQYLFSLPINLLILRKGC